MTKFELLKLFLFHRREWAFHVLTEPIRQEIERLKVKRRKHKHLFERIKYIRNITFF